MRAITIWQPWAWAITHGKGIENRTWGTSYRGELAIHAAQAWDLAGEDSELVREAWTSAAGTTGDRPWPASPHLALGAVIAVAELVDVCTVRDGCQCGPWAVAGRCHWQLSKVRTLPTPVSARGSQGLWKLPNDVAAEVRRWL